MSEEKHDHHNEGEHGGHEHHGPVHGPNISRRQFVGGVVGVGAAVAGLTMISPILNYTPLALEVQTLAPGDVLAYDSGPNAGKPILVTDLKDWDAVSALPSSGGKLKASKDNYIEVVKVPANLLKAPTVFKAPLNAYQLKEAGGPTGPIDWTEQGIVAYSAVCTHLGCTIETTVRTKPDGTKYILCPCHGSEYDPLAGMAVVHPPAPRALPQLPIKIDATGQIVVQGFFAGKVGPS